MKPWPFIVAVIMLAGTWGVIESLSYGDTVQSKKDFEKFPLTMAKHWKGKELGLEEKVLKVLKLSDYMMRVYWPTAESENANTSKVSQQNHPVSGEDAQTGPVWLYVGY